MLHGPISGVDLAAKARDEGSDIPAKNVPGLLAAAINRKEVIVKKRDGANWYMTPAQAETGAHVMSTPASSTKQIEDENPVNESGEDEAMPPADPLLLAMANRELGEQLETANRTIDTLRDNIADLLSDWTDIRQALDVSTHEEALQAISAMDERITDREREITRLEKASSNLFDALDGYKTAELHSESGRLALLLIDSADLTEVEELDDDCDPRIAKAAAMARIDQGHAARAVVVRIIGEAARRVEWKQAA